MQNISRWNVLFLYLKDWGIIMTAKHYFWGTKNKFIRPDIIKKKQDELIVQKIEKISKIFYNDIVKLNRKYQESKSDVCNDVIWQYWDKKPCPELIKICTNSVKKHSKKRIELNDENLREWYVPSKKIQKKLERGLISKTHFSDILRVNLLYNYGGCWLDSTIFLRNNIDFIFYNDFWTIKIGNINSENTCSPIKDRWAGFAIATREKNKLMWYLSNLFDLYWERYDTLIDYFLIDIFICVLYNFDPQIKNMIDRVETNNTHCLSLEYEINEHVQEIPKEFFDTSLFKLNWRRIKIKEDELGITLYGKLFEEYGEF